MSPARLYEALTPTWSTVAELSEVSNVAPRTARRALRALQSRGLAEEESGTWRRGPADLDEVARRRGSAGAGADLKNRHQQERLAYRGSEIAADGRRLYVVTDASPRSPCAGTTGSGQPCRAAARRGSDFCVRHGPAAASAAAGEGGLCERDLAWARALEQDLAWEQESGYGC